MIYPSIDTAIVPLSGGFQKLVVKSGKNFAMIVVSMKSFSGWFIQKEKTMEEEIRVPFKTLYKTTHIIMAVTVQEDLARAGFVVLVNQVSDNEYHVVIASNDYENAHALLVTNPKYGDIFTPPKE